MKSSARGSLSECMTFGQIFSDLIHPRGMGQILLSDILITYLEKAFISFGQTNAAEQLQRKQGIVSQALPQPIKPESLTVPKMRCFGSLGAAGVDDTWDHQLGSPEASDSSISGSDDVAKSSSAGRFRQPTHIEIVRASNGWHFIDMDGPKHKPGWVSNQAGSILIVSVDVSYISGSFDNGIGGDGGSFGERSSGGVDIILSFLSSYEQMGLAQVSCISGCKCQQSTYDGHVTEFRHSIPKDHSIIGLSLTQGYSRCLIQLEVLSDTHSQSHKVKLLQVAVKTYINASQYLSLIQH